MERSERKIATAMILILQKVNIEKESVPMHTLFLHVTISTKLCLLTKEPVKDHRFLCPIFQVSNSC